MKQAFLCDNKEKLLKFLQGIDSRMPVPLHEIVDLDEYAEKVLRLGHAAVKEDNGHIICAACFYCNDEQSKSAYLSLLGTLHGYEGKGCASQCLALAEQVCKEHGMLRLRLDAVPTNTRAVRFYEYHGYVIDSADQKLHLVKEF